MLALGQDGPQNSCVLVGHRDQSLVKTHACLQLDDPAREPVVASVGRQDRGACALKQQGSQIGVPLFCDAPEPRLAAATVLLGHDA